MISNARQARAGSRIFSQWEFLLSILYSSRTPENCYHVTVELQILLTEAQRHCNEREPISGSTRVTTVLHVVLLCMVLYIVFFSWGIITSVICNQMMIAASTTPFGVQVSR
jgi:hypothetical protein